MWSLILATNPDLMRWKNREIREPCGSNEVANVPVFPFSLFEPIVERNGGIEKVVLHTPP